ncbi:MAG: DUF2281 domain-containing protein [Phycisphaeraceae bacterium]
MTPRLKQLVEKLDSNQLREPEDFAEFLAGRTERTEPTVRGRLRLDWAGGLSHLRDRYTSVELQHQAMEWRSGKPSD